MPVRAALLAYFELEDLPRLLQAVAGSGMPPGVRVHIGTFGVSQDASEQIRAVPNRRYSPMFKTQRTAAWEGRHLTPREEQLVGPRFRGPVPPESRILQLSASQRIGWGVEIGRRYRDTMRAARRTGVRIDSWQLDELATQLAGGQGRQYREFVRGILQGLTFGRRVLGDREGKGFVWSTRRALRLASQPVTAELTAFWRQLDRACFHIVGEEYPDFVGDPRRAARTWSDGQRALASGGPVRRALAGRYVAGLTPGYRIGRGLGGNVRGLSRAELNRWRTAYVEERARLGVAGFGEYHFVFENSRTFVMQDACRAVARGLTLGG
jgi:hypothetical protein